MRILKGPFGKETFRGWRRDVRLAQVGANFLHFVGNFFFSGRFARKYFWNLFFCSWGLGAGNASGDIYEMFNERLRIWLRHPSQIRSWAWFDTIYSPTVKIEAPFLWIATRERIWNAFTHRLLIKRVSRLVSDLEMYAWKAFFSRSSEFAPKLRWVAEAPSIYADFSSKKHECLSFVKISRSQSTSTKSGAKKTSNIF